MVALLTISMSAQSQPESPMSDSAKQMMVEKYAEALYRDAFHREGSTQEVKCWAEDLVQKEQTTEEVVRNFLDCEEYRTQFVTNTDLWYLDRKPSDNKLR
jgi:hypothetical protein